jgi:hypothetical protein
MVAQFEGDMMEPVAADLVETRSFRHGDRTRAAAYPCRPGRFIVRTCCRCISTDGSYERLLAGVASWQTAGRQLARPVVLLRGDREDRRRPDARQDGHQRAFEGIRPAGIEGLRREGFGASPPPFGGRITEGLRRPPLRATAHSMISSVPAAPHWVGGDCVPGAQ